MMSVRTTLTLDADLFDLVRAEAARGRRSFREVLNERLRKGFSTVASPDGSPFQVEPFGVDREVVPVDETRLNQLVDLLENDTLL